MAKKRKFKTEKQILDAIDKVCNAAKENLRKAELLEESSQTHFKIAAVSKYPEAYAHEHQGKVDLEDSLLFRKRATRQIEVRAKKLKQVLAEFQTVPMPFLGNDIGVVMQ